MTNTELNLVTSAINDVESEIRKLDGLTANAEASKSTIAKLTAEVEDLHSNKANLDSRARATKLTSGSALLLLEQSDLKAINSGMDAQVDRVLDASRHATTLLQTLHAAVLASRKADIEAMVRRTFNPDKTFVPIEVLAAGAYSITELDELYSTLFHYRTRDERDVSIYDARRLRARSASLIGWAKDLLDEAGAIPAPEPVLAAA
jgi:hypothetical protein